MNLSRKVQPSLVAEVIDEGEPGDGKPFDLANDNGTGINSYFLAEKAEGKAEWLFAKPETLAGNEPVFRDYGHAFGEADIATEEDDWVLGEIHVLTFFGDVAQAEAAGETLVGGAFGSYHIGHTYSHVGETDKTHIEHARGKGNIAAVVEANFGS